MGAAEAERETPASLIRELSTSRKVPVSVPDTPLLMLASAIHLAAEAQRERGQHSPWISV